jgi:cob(I)alamin adenosyltransferase
MKIYTRTGDEGETGLFGGPRVRKDAARVEAYGAVDELNAVLGVARAQLDDAALAERLQAIQSALFDLGAELATPDVEDRAERGQVVARVEGGAVAELEAWIDELESELEPLEYFILPGGDAAAAALHHARTVCRRAERRAVTLAGLEGVSAAALRYLNRLSDLLFVLARVVNHRTGVEEPRWVGRDRA